MDRPASSHMRGRFRPKNSHISDPFSIRMPLKAFKWFPRRECRFMRMIGSRSQQKSSGPQKRKRSAPIACIAQIRKTEKLGKR
jgi:hypothetical protein